MRPWIVALVPDLLAGSRIEEAARRLGTETTTASSEPEAINLLNDGARLLIVDLSERGLDLGALAQAARTSGTAIIAFGPHVDTARSREALAAGIERVYARSRFLRETQAVLAKHLS